MNTYYLVRCWAQAVWGQDEGDEVYPGLGMFDYRADMVMTCYRCPDGTICCMPQAPGPQPDCCRGETRGTFNMYLVYLLDARREVLLSLSFPTEDQRPPWPPLEILSLSDDRANELTEQLRPLGGEALRPHEDLDGVLDRFRVPGNVTS